MDVLVYNPQKGRLETITAHFTEHTTTWFEGTGSLESISTITDLDNGLLITPAGREYPVIIYDIPRDAIDYNRKKAGELFRQVLL